jgi:hypothetical protein
MQGSEKNSKYRIHSVDQETNFVAEKYDSLANLSTADMF